MSELAYRHPRTALEREALARRMEQLARDAPTNVQAHARLLHKDDKGRALVAARHHAFWTYMLEAPWVHNDERYRWVVIVAPPGYAKSTWNTIVGATWVLGTRPNDRIGLISNTAVQAWGFAGAIQDVVEGSTFQRVYGVYPNLKRGWTQQQCWTSGNHDMANPSLLATGMRGPVQGKRFDTVFLDDPTTWEEARSTAVMERQRRWLKSTLMARFPPGKRITDEGTQGRMVCCLTRWGSTDLVPTLEDLGFTVVRMPALGFWDATRDETTGELLYGTAPLWPQLHPRTDLLAMRDEDELIFELVMQGDEKAGLGGEVFNPDWWQRGPLPKGTVWNNVVQFVDTAGGKDRKAGDAFAMATVALHENGVQDWLVDMQHGRFPAPQQERVVKQTAERITNMLGRLDTLVIEDKNEGTALYQNLAGSTRLPLFPYTPGPQDGDKEWRAIPLSNAYRTLRMWHPEGEKWVRGYEAEAEAFPNGPHDDRVDAASGAYNHSARPGPRLRVLSQGG